MEKNMSDNGETSKEKPTVSFYILWSVVGLMLFCASFNVSREKGFCFDKMAFLQDIYTEEQLIDKAILFLNKEMPGSVGFNDGRPPRKLKRYTSPAEFRKLNPNCCQLSEKGPENYANPAYKGYIIVDFPIYYEDTMEKHNGYEYYLAYDSCGKIYDRYIY